ncbi:MAG: TIGR02680 family protein [Actinobacteria bacterium]|nr:TIGR02680 family protein [Actinomycetota bacterium]
MRARIEQLRASHAYQAVEQMEDLDRLVRTCLRSAAGAAAELARRQAATGRGRGELDRAGQVLATMQAAVSRAAAELAKHAGEAGIRWQPGDASPGGLAERAGARAAVRLEAVRAVRAALAEHRKAEQARDLARLTLDRSLAALAAAGQAEQAAADAVRQAVTDAQDALVTWAARHAGLLPDPEWQLLTEALRDAVDRFGEPDAPALEAVYNAAAAAGEQHVRDEQAALRAERGATSAERDRVAAERDRIAAERDDAPPPYPGRTADREDRAGAPLWRLVRFAGHVPDDRAAAIEAALQATGMLDAWITPASDEVTADDGFLIPGATVPGASLADVLEPEDGTPVPAGRVTAVLGSIAMDGELFSAAAVIGADGRYSHGVTAGRHGKEHAEFIGATARARRRAARIAECDATIAELDDRLAALDRRAAGLAGVLAAFADARTTLPPTTAIATAQREHSRAAGQLRGARESAEQAQAAFDESVAACTVTGRVVHRAAAEHSLDPDSVDRVEAATRRFESAGADLAARHREESRQAGAVAEAEARLDHAAREEADAGDAERTARLRHTEEAAKLDALRGAAGLAAQQVLAQIHDAQAGLAAAQGEEKAARAAEIDAIRGAAQASERVAKGADALAVAAGEERATARGLAPFAARELLDVLACPPGLAWPAADADWEGPDLPGPVLGVYEAILAATRDLTPTETSLKMSTTRLTRALEELQAQLAAAGQDYHPEWDGADGVIVVRIADEQGPLPAGAFAARIAAARRDQQLLLSESEQRILEDALLTRLAQQIHDRTVDARDLIRRMNTEMRSRKMSSGKTVGVKWQLADHLDEEQRAVCGLLDAGASRLSPDTLTRMRSHFAAQIKTARARHRELPYRELLAHVLDYRRWRQFSFQLVSPEGGEETLTRARHSRLSGGEQSVSLHLPLFAAAHAMLNSAYPHAPRLLALDEAFAGVDDTGRGELMSLAAQFDLDLFMTGYDLWATESSIRAAAHYDLAHSPIQHTVSALLLVWDGAELIADEAGELGAALGSPGTRRTVTAAA